MALKFIDKATPAVKPVAKFTKPFKSVAVARTPKGYVTVTSQHDAEGNVVSQKLGKPQMAPYGQPYVAADAMRILQAAVGAQ